jgi:hypothetical protein
LHQVADAGYGALDLTELVGRHTLLTQIEQRAGPAAGLRLGYPELGCQRLDQPGGIGRRGFAGPCRRCDGKQGGGEQNRSPVDAVPHGVSSPSGLG